ncbi:flagellar biosynthesis repressor FlbT [Sphingomonas sp. KRR8]|uniref:flagellar biosynthesis repressor FlbT n=1 Tax=Sphingomonas sp. KRR8 TaxID=2942996 RepID=UPI002020DC67|nr:flagellar biosynthesis repressor FlbT [Sphingomonas sp. KRR8]URD61388.1 flagellar biosynthesis repressor FlbT [Sphingomonas sp. KRR8]
MTLRIALKDGEKVVLNGAVLRSVGRTELLVESKAALLRGREIMSPEDAVTPAQQLYFHTMMAYIDPERRELHQRGVVDCLGQVARLLASPDANRLAMSFAGHAAGMQYYRALTDCRQLIAQEKEVLAAVDVPALAIAEPVTAAAA